MMDRVAAPAVRVATLPELFRSKVLASSNRCLSRDWIDLYVLVTQAGFTISDFRDVFYREGVLIPGIRISQAFRNLCRGVASPSDPGYEMLMDGAPTVAQ